MIFWSTSVNVWEGERGGVGRRGGEGGVCSMGRRRGGQEGTLGQ